MAIGKTTNKLTLDKVLKNFPLKTPRDIQVEAIRKTVDHYNNGAKYVVLEAPVGTGKSAIAVALMRTMGDSSYLQTLTEQLQDQYIGDFAEHGLVSLKGRGKFKCKNLTDGTCADGKHAFTGKHACQGCPYKVARKAAFEAEHMVANYHSFLFNVAMNKGEDEGPPPTRPLLVVDEAHSMEAFLLDNMSVTVRLSKLSVQLPPPPENTDSAEPYFDYISEDVLPALKKVALTLKDSRAKEENAQFCGKLQMVLDSRDEVQWIPERGVIYPSKALDRSWFTLKPLNVAQWGSLLWGLGDRQLFMSGTILSGYQFCASVGLNPDEGDHIEMDSPFPAANRPIWVGNLDMSKKARFANETTKTGGSWEAAAKMTDNLMTSHATVKGLLLCPSNEMLKYLHSKMSRTNAGRLIFATGEDRTNQYNRHLNAKTPTVLAASGYWEGANLADDASRFQIIPQLPRPMFQGQVAARVGKPNGNEWYRWQTMMKFGQGSGRSVRSDTDEAVTYVFDKELRAELKKSDCMIPKWMRDAIHLVGEKPAVKVEEEE